MNSKYYLRLALVAIAFGLLFQFAPLWLRGGVVGLAFGALLIRDGVVYRGRY